MQWAARIGAKRLLGTILAVAAMFMALVSEMFVMLYVQTQAVPPFHPSDKVPIIFGGLISAGMALGFAATCVCLFASRGRGTQPVKFRVGEQTTLNR